MSILKTIAKAGAIKLNELLDAAGGGACGAGREARGRPAGGVRGRAQAVRGVA